MTPCFEFFPSWKATELEGYKVLEPVVLYAKIGEGGMGVVYRGKHLSLSIDVALKCLKTVIGPGNLDVVARFKREAMLAASINNQNLVRVFDVNEMHGLHYIVMEFVCGESARERVDRKGPLGIEESLIIVRNAARGLAAAHAQGIVHRDIKPDNILISTKGEVKVADLGLAKASFGGGETLQSIAGQFMGTPNYAPPEQFSDTSTVGASGDVYALAATLYFLLTGKHGIAPGSLYQVMRCICEEPFPDVGADRFDLPDGLAEVLLRATAKDPKERPANAREFGKELSAFITTDDEERDAFLKDLNADHDFESESALVSPPPLKTIARIQTQLRPGLQVEVATAAPPSTEGVSQGPREKTVQVSEEDMAKERAAALAEASREQQEEPSTARSSPLLMAVVVIFGIVALVVGTNWAKERERERNLEDEEQITQLAKTAETAKPTKKVESEPKVEVNDPLVDPITRTSKKVKTDWRSQPINWASGFRKYRLQSGLIALEPEPLQKVASALGMKFQPIKSGSFMMGSPASEEGRDADETQHRVTLTEDFYMATTELTQGQWQKVMNSTPWSGKRSVKNGSNVAASYLSWDDAQKYCAVLNKRYPHDNWEFRLPTEAEWEYCCRAGSSTAYSFGASATSLGKYAWFRKNAEDVGEKYAHLVQQKRSNNWGLFDMHGNVWEWCQDWYSSSYSGRSTNPKGPTTGSGRVNRGGGWSGSWLFIAQGCRSANRFRDAPDLRYCNLGFRLVLAPK